MCFRFRFGVLGTFSCSFGFGKKIRLVLVLVMNFGFGYCHRCLRLEDPARVLKAGRAPPSILRAGEMRQTKVEAAPTAMRSPNFWAGCSQNPTIGLEVITLCCLITVPPTRCVDACLAVVVGSERK